MKINPAQTLRKPSYPALLAAAAMGTMLAPVNAQSGPPAPGAVKQVQSNNAQSSATNNANKLRTPGRKQSPPRLGGVRVIKSGSNATKNKPLPPPPTGTSK